MRDDIPYDFIAIGLGPFNLGLACLAEPLENVRSLFLEKKERFTWHGGMLLKGTTLQNPFLADLVSMADPTSPLSYLNYCKQQGRLYTYYIRENWYLTREEFNRYCIWAAGQLTNVRYQHNVQEIWHDAQRDCYVIAGTAGNDSTPFELICKKLVIGIGAVPHIPACHANADHPAHKLHTSNYLEAKTALQRCKNITVVGSGQSGAEVYQDLLLESERHGYSLNWVTRASRFFQMENAKLTLELITPDYGQYFYGLAPDVKQRVLADQRSIYNGINQSLIENIYQTLDERRHRDAPPARQMTNLALRHYEQLPSGQWALTFEHTQLGHQYRHVTDGLIFATGYRYQLPGFIEGIRERIRWDATGLYAPSKGWAVDHDDREIYVQNVGLQSHGLTNPDLGLACYRNSRLLAELTGRDPYPCEPRTAFQDFVPPADCGFERLDSQGIHS